MLKQTSDKDIEIISNGLLIHCAYHYKMILSIWKAFWLYVVGQGAPTFWFRGPTSGTLARDILQNMGKVICCKLYITALFILKTRPQLQDARGRGYTQLPVATWTMMLLHVSLLCTYSWSLPEGLSLPCVCELSSLLSLILNTFDQHFPGSLFHPHKPSYTLPFWPLETTCN